MKWNKPKDILPPLGVTVIVYSKLLTGNGIGISHLVDNPLIGKAKFDCEIKGYDKVIYWVNLPAIPDEDKEIKK